VERPQSVAAEEAWYQVLSGPNQVPVPLPQYHRRARRDSLPGVVVVADGHLKEVGITLEHPLLYLLWLSNRII
jgi:hypothetical protein